MVELRRCCQGRGSVEVSASSLFNTTHRHIAALVVSFEFCCADGAQKEKRWRWFTETQTTSLGRKICHCKDWSWNPEVYSSIFEMNPLILSVVIIYLFQIINMHWSWPFFFNFKNIYISYSGCRSSFFWSHSWIQEEGGAAAWFQPSERHSSQEWEKVIESRGEGDNSGRGRGGGGGGKKVVDTK